MAFTNWGFIYLGTGHEDPAADRAVIERSGLRTTIVAVPDRTAAVDTAVDLVEAGAQSIELCGGFGPLGRQRGRRGNGWSRAGWRGHLRRRIDPRACCALPASGSRLADQAD